MNFYVLIQGDIMHSYYTSLVPRLGETININGNYYDVVEVLHDVNNSSTINLNCKRKVF